MATRGCCSIAQAVDSNAQGSREGQLQYGYGAGNRIGETKFHVKPKAHLPLWAELPRHI